MFSDNNNFGIFGLYDDLKREADKIDDVTKMSSFVSGFICKSNVAYMKRYANEKDIDKLRKYLNFKGGVYITNKMAIDRYVVLIKENIFTEKQWREVVIPAIEVFDFNHDLERIIPELNACLEQINEIKEEKTREVYIKNFKQEFENWGIFTNPTFDSLTIDKLSNYLCIYNDKYIKIITDLYNIVRPFYKNWPDCLETISQLIFLGMYKTKIIL